MRSRVRVPSSPPASTGLRRNNRLRRVQVRPAHLGGAWSGGGQNSAIRLGSRMLAQYKSNGADFSHVNVLGSETQNTDYAGNGGQAILYYPWGQVWQNPWEAIRTASTRFSPPFSSTTRRP